MMKLLNVILILAIAYLIYIAIFTNKASVCEPLINMDSKINQLVTYKDLSDNDYVMIRLEHIKNSEGQPDRELISQLYSKIAEAIPDYDALVGQSSQIISETLKSSITYLIREPILLVKVADVTKLTQNTVISGLVKEVTYESKTNKYLLPFDSNFIGPVLNGNLINNRVFGLGKMLFLDLIIQAPISIDDMTKLYLHEIHDHAGIKIYIAKTTGAIPNEIKLI